jgi:hypothetical protein
MYVVFTNTSEKITKKIFTKIPALMVIWNLRDPELRVSLGIPVAQVWEK